MQETISAIGSKERRAIGLERQLVLTTLAYTWIAILFWTEGYVRVLTHYIVVFVILVPLLLIPGLIAAALLHRPFAPVSFLGRLLRERGLKAAGAVAIACVGVAAFTTLKSQLVAPFFADALLADLDDLLHLGWQPWRFTHAVMPAEASYYLARLYGPGWFIQLIGVLLLAALLRDEALRRRYFLSLVAAMLLLGTFLRLLASSAGPIFYDRLFGGSRFLELTTALEADPGSGAIVYTANYLHSAYVSESARFGAGISAMPSMHVALAVLNALFLSRVSGWLGVLGWAYAACILFGSVHFGWHYALDGYVSAVAILLLWRWAGERARPALGGRFSAPAGGR